MVGHCLGKPTSQLQTYIPMSQILSFQSDYFTFKEIFKNCSKHEILSALDSHILRNIVFTVSKITVLRKKCGVPFHVTSWYRDSEHNSRVGGVPTSFHLEGLAVDFRISSKHLPHVLATIKHAIYTKDLPIDQFIIYKTFLHISFRKENVRYQIIDKRYESK